LRLKTLNLERYGHFTNKQLHFREGACLHVVYGANEAGKSCSLAAVTDLFFKFESKSEWDFLHPGKLSVGATIVGRGGETLSFKRRKGTKFTLLDPSGAALPEDSLDVYLGSLTRETFSRAFGLSAKGLRRGAKEMLKSGGEVGASLFVAASGLRGLNELKSRLAAEAGAIFMPTRSQTRTFYQALIRHESAARELKEREFKESELKKRTARIETLDIELATVRARRRADELHREQLERLCEVAPLLGTIVAQEQALAVWDGLPEINESELVRLQRSHQANVDAEVLLERLADEHADAKLYAESFQIEVTLLAEDAAIQSLQSQTGAFTEKKGQIGGVRAEGDKLRRDLEGMHLRLGLPIDADLASLQPTDATVTRARRLVMQGRGIQQEQRANFGGREKERKELSRLSAERAAAGAVEDPGPIRLRLQRLMPVLVLLESSEKSKRKLELDQTRLATAGRALSPAVTDLDRSATLVLPEQRVIQQFASEWEEASRRSQPLDARVVVLSAAVEEGKTTRTQFDAKSPIASPKRIAEERAVRDGAWMGLRRVLLEEEKKPELGTLAGRLIGFEGATAEADRLADQAIAEADRLAEYLANERQIGLDEAEHKSLKAQLQQVRDAETDLQRRWLALWEPLNTVPKPPSAMLLWLAELTRLLERYGDLLTDANALHDFESEVVQVRPVLDELLVALGVEDGSRLSEKLALAAAEAELEKRERQWKDATDLLVRERETDNRLRLLDEAATQLSGELAAWNAEWQTILPSLQQTLDADCDEVEAVLALWLALPGKLEALAVNTRRVSGMRRDINSFDEQTTTLLARLGETTAGVDSDAVVKLLSNRLGKAKGQQGTHDEAVRALTLLNGNLENAKSASASRREEFELLSAMLPVSEDPAVLLESLERRAKALQELAARRETLASLARGKSEGELRTDLEGWNEAEALASVSRLRQDDGQYNDQENQAFANLQDARRELETLQSGTGAELALQLKRNAEAKLLHETHAWAVKRIGQILLTHAVENHRSRQEQPLLRRASELFGLLTAGSFVSIEQERDNESDSEKISLVGRRDAEHTVCVPAMSTGTRDQLYLALRLAYLEQYAASTEAVPFIGDDLFTSSDERRTAKGLKALAATGHLIQPILFTHHEHVVELARRELGDGVDVLVLER
jgi:uncharacterized protein YhaN